jgi:two-component system cell cycle sensor histidine kinase PleC
MGQLVSRRRAERALRAAALESAVASRAKTEFLANMSHELRTPLNAIIGFGDILQQLQDDELQSESTKEYAAHIARAGRHLLGIIGDILDISKIEAGKFILKIQPASLTDIIEASSVFLRPRFQEKNQVFNMRVQENLPLVSADELRLKQVLLNLLSNANKFTPVGGKIFLVATTGEAGTVTVAVSDSGRGMSAEEVEHALKPFAQIQWHYDREQEGTGLGLPIAKALILQHGGKFHVNSTPGAGTTVAFTVPVHIARAHSGASASAA